MPDTDYIAASHDPDNVKLIKDYALFLLKKGTLQESEKPKGKTWTPPSTVKPVGYNSEDGATLHPEAGDTNDFKGHNGAIVLSETSGGYWTLKLAGIECKKSMAEAYFGVEADANGGVHVNDAANSQAWEVVLAALDQKGRPLVFYAPDAQISEREDVALNHTNLLQMGATFKLRKPKGAPMFSLWGLVEDVTAAPPQGGGGTPGH